MKTLTIDWKQVVLKNSLLVWNIENITDLDQLKLLECRQLILDRYSETDQRNCALFWTEQEKEEMSTYIQAMITEYRTKWKDADFSNIN